MKDEEKRETIPWEAKDPNRRSFTVRFRAAGARATAAVERCGAITAAGGREGPALGWAGAAFASLRTGGKRPAKEKTGNLLLKKRFPVFAFPWVSRRRRSGGGRAVVG